MPALPDLPDGLTDRVAFLLQSALARAQAMGERALAELGIVGREYGVLALLQHAAPSTQHRLGAALGIDRTSTMKLLAGLETRGLVRRVPSPADRRAYVITLTEAGEDLRARAAVVLADCDERFLDRLSVEQRAQLRQTLQQLL